LTRNEARVLLAVCLALGVGGCTEDPITATDAASAPGFSTPTIEVFLEVGDLPSWRDTTYWGFSTPNSASYQLLANQEDLAARVLGRFSTVPDSLFVDTARVAIDSFVSASIRITVDTLYSDLPDGDMEIAVWSLSRGFDADDVTWLLARPGEPWTTPGGDLAVRLGVDTVSFRSVEAGSLLDTVRVPLDLDADSLLTAWRDADGEPGFAIVVSGPPGELRTVNIALLTEAAPQGLDTLVAVARGAVPGTFIFDPPTPGPTTRLRLAGMPSARYYMTFELPDSLGPLELRGATINRATLEFRPTSAPPEPFPLRENGFAQAVRLLADPFVYGEKTPVGQLLGGQLLLRPDSLASGNTMQYDITALVRFWSQAPIDSIPDFAVGILPVPENRQFGYWEFFSAEDGPGLQPVVHLLFTPNPSFLFP
jgi:hypothetical protein